MKKLQISLCALLTLGCISQSAQAMFTREQLSTQALALHDQAKNYIQSHPTETKAFMGAAIGATAGILAATTLYLRNRTIDEKRGYCSQEKVNAVILRDCKYGKKLLKYKTIVDALQRQHQNIKHPDLDYNCRKYIIFRTSIYQGGVLADQLLNNLQKPFSSESKIDGNRHVRNLSWFLYSLAIYKGQSDPRKPIIIEDEDQCFFNYLCDYVKLLNEDKNTKHYGYKRTSSYFDSNEQYGIDIVANGSKEFLRYLPGDLSHVLFGKVDKKHTFIKFEHHRWFHPILHAITSAGQCLPFINRLFNSDAITITKNDLKLSQYYSIINCNETIIDGQKTVISFSSPKREEYTKKFKEQAQQLIEQTINK